MLENLTEMLKGVLEGCVLDIISHEEIYGYEITRRLIEAYGTGMPKILNTETRKLEILCIVKRQEKAV